PRPPTRFSLNLESALGTLLPVVTAIARGGLAGSRLRDVSLLRCNAASLYPLPFFADCRLRASPLPVRSAMEDRFGARLRHHREQRGVTLAEICANTKIKPSLLESLESD